MAALGILRCKTGLGKVFQRPAMPLGFQNVLIKETVIVRAGKGLVGKLGERSGSVHPGHSVFPVQQVKHAAILHVKADREGGVLQQRAIRLVRLPMRQIRQPRTDRLQALARRVTQGCILQRVHGQLGVSAFFDPGGFKYPEIGLDPRLFKFVCGVIFMIVEPGLFIHAPGVLSDQQQPAVEVDERAFIRGRFTLFDPFRAQTQQFTIAADLDRVSAHAVDPGITDLGGHNGQGVAYGGKMGGEIR